MYFSGQGKCYVAPAVNGVPGAFRFVGNVPSLTINLQTQVLEHKESTSGQRLTDLRLIQQKSAAFNLTLEDFNKENLALALFGSASAVTGSTVTNEAFPAALVAGNIVRTARQKISAITVKDSAGSPATLVLNTDYRVLSADHGTIEILNIGSYVQPFKIDYTYAAVENVAMFTQGLTDRWLKFDGLNTADTAVSNRPVLLEIYRCAFDPVNTFGLISDEIVSMELSGSALYDSTKANDALLGQFGRAVLI